MSSDSTSAEILSQRYGSMPWKELIKNVDAGISQMLYYCESNQDWLKAIEANELLQSKLSTFASLIGKFATGSLDSPNQKTTGPMFGVAKAPPTPLSMTVGNSSAPSSAVFQQSNLPPAVLNRQPEMFVSPFPSQPPIHPSGEPYISHPSSNHPRPAQSNPMRRPNPTDSPDNYPLTVNTGGAVRNQGSSRQSATRLRPEAPVFMPKKEESDFMRATEASMAKVRRVASSTNVTKDSGRITNTDVRGSNEARRSTGSSSGGNGLPNPSSTGTTPVATATSAGTTGAGAPSHAGTKPKRESGSGGPFSLPPPAVASDEKDDWEEKVKAEMQAATEQVWQAAEAWVDAEAEVEELEWRILEMGIGRYVGLIDAPIDVDEIGSGKVEVKSAKKEKLLLDTAFQNVDDSTYWAVRHSANTTISPEKRATRYSTPQKSDEYPSPQSGSGTKLHSKLSSPDRRRSLTPTEALRKIEARLSAAEVNRDRSVHEKVQKAQLVSNRVKMRNEKEAERLMLAGEALHSKLHSATQRHSDYIALIKGRAGNENAKVNEVLTANALNSEMVSQQLQQKLEEVEAKILAANLRREQRLAGIIGSQKKKNNKKALQMSEYRLQLEKVKMDRWEKLQRRIEAVQERRRVRIAEMKRRAEDEAYKSQEDMLFSAPSDSLDPIAEDAMITGQYGGAAPAGNELRRSGTSLGETGSTGHRFGISSVHSSPGRKSTSGAVGAHDDESELASMVAENEGLFMAPEWLEIPLEVYSDFKSASSLAHKLLTESMLKAKIRQWRKDAYAKALSCLWAATGFYHHYYTADLVGCDEPLKAVIEHLIARRKSMADGEEREASSFNMYSGLICEIGTDGLFQHPEAIEKINYVLASVIDQLQHASSPPASGDAAASGAVLAPVGTSESSSSSSTHRIDEQQAASIDVNGDNATNDDKGGNISPVVVPSIYQPVDDFVNSGGLLLLSVFLSYEFGLLCEGSIDSAWLLDSKWFDIESKVLLGKSTSVDLQAILRLVRVAIERIESNVLLACCALHHVLGEMALYLSLIIYRGRCENITFRASEHTSTQKIQEILGEVLTLWALVIEKMILMTNTSVTQSLQLFSLIVPGRVGSSLQYGASAAASSPVSHATSEKNGMISSAAVGMSGAPALAEEDTAMQRQLDDIIFAYFQYTFLCQDLANFFTSIHVAVLSVQLSIEESFITWKMETPKRLPRVCNGAFLRMITGAAEYATALTVFIRWGKAHSNPAYHTLAKHWWSLMRKANIMSFLYGSFALVAKQFFVSLYCHTSALTVHDIDVLLHTSLAIMKTIFAMLMVDAEIFKQLSVPQKATFLFHAHILLLLVTKLMDYGKEGITDECLQPTLGELQDESLQQIRQWSESALQQLLLVLTLISERDVEIRRTFGERHVVEEMSKLEDYMKVVFADSSVTNTSNNAIVGSNALATTSTATTTATSSLPGLLFALCHLPSRFFKASRTKHSVCTCIISVCMELEQHVVMVRQAGKERYLYKFVEYMLREFDAAKSTSAGESQEVVDKDGLLLEEDDHRVQRQERIQRCLALIPEEYWKTVIRLVWIKE